MNSGSRPLLKSIHNTLIATSLFVVFFLALLETGNPYGMLILYLGYFSLTMFLISILYFYKLNNYIGITNKFIVFIMLLSAAFVLTFIYASLGLID
jgi:hypothetical protein